MFGKKDDYMPIYKRCSRCGRRIHTGTTCSCIKQRHKEYDKMYRDKEAKKYYDSGEWQQARAAALEADDGIDYGSILDQFTCANVWMVDFTSK